MNITIYTPLPLERQAVLFHLEATKELQIGGCLGIQGRYKGLYHSFQVTVIVTGSGNSLIASVVERTIVPLNPSLVFLVGIAGGVKDVEIGDVTVGTKSYGYESGKAKESGFKIRPQVFPASRDLLTLAELIEYQNKWRQRSPQFLSTSKVVFGPIASGDKVIATTSSPVYQLLKQAYNDTIALEMEAFGFGQALHAHPNVRWLNVRGISDLLDNKKAQSDAKHQPLAAAQAAAFVFEMLYQFEASKFNLPIMNVKDLTKVIYDILFPIGRLESVQDIGKDLSEATNTSVRKLWQKVKPLFIEEFEDLQAEPADEDAQAAIRSKLKRSLSRDEGLKVEVEALAQAILQKEENNASVMVSNSSSVMTGGEISGNKNVQFGDTNTTSTTNIGQQSNNSGEIGSQINNYFSSLSPTPKTNYDDIKRGKLDFDIPRLMTMGNIYKSIFRISKSDFQKELFKISNQSTERIIRVSDVMIVELKDISNDNFNIIPLSDLEQFIEDNYYTEWKFNIEPLKPGKHKILLKVSIKFILENYGEKLKNIMVLDEIIEVTALEKKDSYKISQQNNNYGHIDNQNNITNNQGTINIADTIHIHQVLAEGTKDISLQKRVSGIENIHDLIGKNKMKAALEELLRLSKSMDKDVQNQVILLTSRWNRLKQERFGGTISSEAANIQQNKILMGVLGMLEEFE